MCEKNVHNALSVVFVLVGAQAGRRVERNAPWFVRADTAQQWARRYGTLAPSARCVATSSVRTICRFAAVGARTLNSTNRLPHAERRATLDRIRRYRRPEHHGDVVAVGPICFRSKLIVDALEELGSGKRDTRRKLRHHRDESRAPVPPCSEFLASFAGIAKLQEVAGSNAVSSQVFAGLAICSTRVPLSIASRIFCEPDSRPSRPHAQPARRRAETVVAVIRSTRDCILKGIAASSFFDFRSEFAHPFLAQSRRCRRRTTDVRHRIRVSELFISCRDLARRSYGERVAINRLGAPVAAIGAAATGDNVQ